MAYRFYIGTRAYQTAPSITHKRSRRTATTVVVQAVNRLTTKSIDLATMFVPLLRWQHQHRWFVTARYFRKELIDSVKGFHGMTADESSRVTKRPSLWDRGLPSELFIRLLQLLDVDPATPILDMFACHETTQSPRFVSRFSDLRNVWTDALSPDHAWCSKRNPLIRPNEMLYCFPPPKLIPDVLAKIRDGGSESVLVVFQYHSRLLVAEIMELAISRLIFFAVNVNDLIHPDGVHAPPLDGRSMTFLALILSKNSSLHGDSMPNRLMRLRQQGGAHGKVSQVLPTTGSSHTGSVSSVAKALHRSILEQDAWLGGLSL